jgi:hypothetical protein
LHNCICPNYDSIDIVSKILVTSSCEVTDDESSSVRRLVQVITVDSFYVRV